MAFYKVSVRESVKAQLRRVPSADLARVGKKMQALADDPRPPGCKKLSDDRGYRLRQGDYRILYAIHDAIRLVEVYRVAHRREAYRDN